MRQALDRMGYGVAWVLTTLAPNLTFQTISQHFRQLATFQTISPHISDNLAAFQTTLKNSSSSGYWPLQIRSRVCVRQPSCQFAEAGQAPAGHSTLDFTKLTIPSHHGLHGVITYGTDQNRPQNKQWNSIRFFFAKEA